MSVYDVCPVLKSEHFTLRLVEREDAPGLLRVYSDEETVRLCNSDNCHYGTFRLDSLEDTLCCIDAWRNEYGLGYFVRWTILAEEEAVGTVELFHRDADDYFTDCGLLRIDLKSEFEIEEILFEILDLLLPVTWELFHCSCVATKVHRLAAERMLALARKGFIPTDEPVIGHRGELFGDYWVLHRDARKA
jgi:hypothetical protein